MNNSIINIFIIVLIIIIIAVLILMMINLIKLYKRLEVPRMRHINSDNKDIKAIDKIPEMITENFEEVIAEDININNKEDNTNNINEYNDDDKEVIEEDIKQDLENNTNNESNNETNNNITVNPINGIPGSIEGDVDKQIITDVNTYKEYGGFIDANSIYVPKDYIYTSDDYGYNYIPPMAWINIPAYGPPRVPMCVSNGNKCATQPSLTSGYPIDLKQWHESRKVTGSAGINIDYIEQHLNTVKAPENIKT